MYLIGKNGSMSYKMLLAIRFVMVLLDSFPSSKTILKFIEVLSPYLMVVALIISAI